MEEKSEPGHLYQLHKKIIMEERGEPNYLHHHHPRAQIQRFSMTQARRSRILRLRRPFATQARRSNTNRAQELKEIQFV
jgi:hypothetical protein